MTYEQIVAALTDAIDQPNPTPPPAKLDGSANEADEQQAGVLLERIVAAKARYDAIPTGSATDDYTARHAAWVAARASTFSELDDSVRRAIREIIEACPQDAGNPLIEADPSVEALKAYEGAPIPDDNHGGQTSGVAHGVTRLAREYLGTSAVSAAIEGALRRYHSAYDKPEPQPARRITVTYEGARQGYLDVKTECETFIGYLEAL